MYDDRTVDPASPFSHLPTWEHSSKPANLQMHQRNGMGRCVGPPDPQPVPRGLTSQESSKTEWRGGEGDLGPRLFLSWFLRKNSFIDYIFQASLHSIISSS